MKTDVGRRGIGAEEGAREDMGRWGIGDGEGARITVIYYYYFCKEKLFFKKDVFMY